MYGNLRMPGRPLRDLILGPSTSGASFLSRGNEKGVHNGMYMPRPNTHKEWDTRWGKYNTDWKEKRRLRKIIKLKPILPILQRNQLVGTFPYLKASSLRYPPR